jgi:hypothetical protein
MTGADDNDIVFLDDVLAAIEARLGVDLAALDADDLGDLLYGDEMLARVLAEAERDQSNLVPIDEVALTTADWAFLHEVEVEHGIRLVAYHHGADAVLYGGEAIDEAIAKYDAG